MTLLLRVNNQEVRFIIIFNLLLRSLVFARPIIQQPAATFNYLRYLTQYLIPFNRFPPRNLKTFSPSVN